MSEGGASDSAAPDAGALAPRRLHPAGALLAGLRIVRELAIPLLLGSGTALLGSGLSSFDPWLVVGAACAVVGGAALAGYAGWRATSYAIEDGAVRLRRGVLRRQETSVPVERVAGVDTRQGPIRRLFGVLEVSIQAAGGGKAAEVRFSAVTAGAAQELEAALARHDRRPALGEASAPRPIRRLDRRGLLVAALTSGQIGIAVPVLAGALQYAGDLVPSGYEDAAIGLLTGSPAAVLAAVAVALMAVWALSILGTVIAFSGFQVERDGDRLLITRGFLQRRQATVPMARIQAVRVVEGVLRQPFGLAALRVESAGYASEPAVNTTLFPLIPRAEVPAFLAATVPELAGPLGPLRPLPPRALVRLALGPALACLVVGASSAGGAGLPAYVSGAALALALAALGHAGLRHRAAGFSLQGGRLLARSRALARTTVIAAPRRLQTRTLEQGPLQRPLELATFDFALASRRRFRVPQLDVASGWRLLGALRPR